MNFCHTADRERRKWSQKSYAGWLRTFVRPFLPPPDQETVLFQNHSCHFTSSRDRVLRRWVSGYITWLQRFFLWCVYTWELFVCGGSHELSSRLSTGTHIIMRDVYALPPWRHYGCCPLSTQVDHLSLATLITCLLEQYVSRVMSIIIYLFMRSITCMCGDVLLPEVAEDAT